MHTPQALSASFSGVGVSINKKLDEVVLKDPAPRGTVLTSAKNFLTAENVHTDRSRHWGIHADLLQRRLLRRGVQWLHPRAFKKVSAAPFEFERRVEFFRA